MVQFAEVALANELDSPEGGPSISYNLAYGRLLIYRNNFDAAIECLQSIVKVNCQVRIKMICYDYRAWNRDLKVLRHVSAQDKICSNVHHKMIWHFAIT